MRRALLLFAFLTACRPDPAPKDAEPSAEDPSPRAATAPSSASAAEVNATPKPWAKPVERDFEVTILGKKMGDVKFRWEPLADGGYRMTTKSTMEVKVATNDGAISRSEDEDVEEYGVDLALLKSTEVEHENGVEEREEITIANGTLTAKVDKPSHKVEKTLELPKDWSNELIVFARLRERALAGAALPLEEKYGDFDAEDMSFHSDRLRIVERVKFETPSGSVDAWKIESIDGQSGDTITGVSDDAGMPLHAEFGAVKIALRGTGGGSTEMVEIDSRIPVEGTLLSPGPTLFVDLEVKGDGSMEQPVFLDAPSYQKVQRKGDVYALELFAPKGDPTKTAPPRPMTDLAPEVAKFLKPTAASQSEDPGIVAQAKEIVGDEKDSRKAARSIVDWTFKTLKKKDGARGAATAVETLAARAGDCTEHTALSVALARASGIPARMAAGVVLIPGLKPDAGYHAWPEFWLGDWVVMDPALGTLDVGATYAWIGYDEPGEKGRSGKLARLIGRTSVRLK